MATFERSAHIDWEGTVKEGRGEVKAGTGAFALPVTFPARVEAPGGKTSPEELIAAAHAGCFSMALSGQLTNAGTPPESVDTTATVTLEKTDAGFTVTKVHLDVRAKVPGADQAAFETAANNAKTGCPISRLLKAEITMDAKLA